ncbi:hypothetical protein VNO77_03965 [Canavalia gladiata]|uniref:Uncharacterized protein n=1 Tax=Canavalia gladiata TaxID=3824 RepID=A0AAN9MWI7_CANGL
MCKKGEAPRDLLWFLGEVEESSSQFYSRTSLVYTRRRARRERSKPEEPLKGGELHLESQRSRNALLELTTILRQLLDGDHDVVDPADVGALEFALEQNNVSLFSIESPTNLSLRGSMKTAVGSLGTVSDVANEFSIHLEYEDDQQIKESSGIWVFLTLPTSELSIGHGLAVCDLIGRNNKHGCLCICGAVVIEAEDNVQNETSLMQLSCNSYDHESTLKIHEMRHTFKQRRDLVAPLVAHNVQAWV